MSIPSFMLPTNFRNDKNIKRMIKEFDVQGYGIAVYLLETLAETDNHMYPYRDIDLLADEMRISTAKIETVIKRYNIFEIVETTDGDMFISSKLNRWLEPYYAGKEQRQLAGKISAQKRKQKQLKQLLELSQIDSIQRPLNDRSTINELINKLINQSNIDDNEEEKEKWREFAEQQIKKMMETDKLEELALAYRDNQVPI
ncbi:Lin1244/Lin1753 domain-containing protein [Aliarcobacter cryaerophilus]|uniref:Lin1244/Lin1753 domain-containing protein n=1 Tax=Aliarcobacter cryaerophilus TaxID=28198 RepID=UPI003DA4B225